MPDADHHLRRFGSDFVAAHLSRYGRLAPERRSLTYDIAVSAEYDSWRSWLDDQLALLPTADADALARKLWLDEHFWPVNFELATGAWLRIRGLTVAYEQAWQGVTPDWTVLTSAGEPAAFVEVHTAQPRPETYGQIRAWHGLVERIKEIPVPVVLNVTGNSRGQPLAAPDSATSKRVARELRNWLLTGPLVPHYTSCGYMFLVMGDPARGGLQMRSPLGLRACFDPPTSRAGAITTTQLLDRVRGKVSKYRDLADSYGVPLIVAVGAHRFTGLALGDVDDALTGSPTPTIKFQFGAGDPYIGEQTVTMGPVPPWLWPPELAGLLWIDNQLPFTGTLRLNSGAAVPVPDRLLSP